MIAVTLVGLLGCGATNKLQSVTLTPQGNDGFVNLKGEGGTIQFTVMANNTNQQSYNVTNKVTYTVTPIGTDAGGVPLPAAPQTVQMNMTGLITAVEPFLCSWNDLNSPNDSEPGSTLKPAWFVNGSYKIVATFKGVDSNPVYVALASASGNGPSGQCGP